jgi:hypothetical protein
MDHARILLQKDFLTLKRNFVFVFMFLMLPCALMLAFGALHDMIGTEFTPV